MKQEQAQSKNDGVLTFDVPALAPTLYYATGDGSVYGTITTQDPNCYRYWTLQV